MDAFTVLFGLIIWIFAVMGAMASGKKVIRLFVAHVARDPDGFKKKVGLTTPSDLAC